MNEDTISEEVTTSQNQPQRIIKKTTKQIEPEAKGEAPQRVYEKKKTIFRFDQVIWYVLSLIEVLLVFRLVLKVLGANQFNGFTGLIYSITTPLISPFNGIIGTYVTGNSVFEWATIIAGIVYLFIAWGLIYLLNLIYPITPNDVETQ